ncbi:hypothetical protein [Hymenobacter sublimis]|uniref:Uncharacterized protein n=1 Tax=Hymenobacter sublimis TaxID=2933777 RepID=A0ABY4J9W0_9BACT|nr:hypothetical protein [Hymenobacter sublimis]UPL48753.1 hypothetical protein MWH26_16380 [Hymenobacter sublimis]
MQTLTAIQTIEWIDSLFSLKVKEGLFMGALRVQEDKVSSVLEVTHELARLSSIISENKNAVRILKAFELTQLADISFGPKYAQAALTQKAGEPRNPTFLLSNKWRVMITAAKVWKELTIPAELKITETNDSLISIELQFEEIAPPASVLSKAINAIEELYESIRSAYQIEGNETLKIIKADSGSDVRIDLKGAGGVIKHLKDFFLEAWHKIRHKRAEEVVENNKALLSSLAVVQQIESLVSSGSITNEEGERLKYRIINSTISLFDSRALPGNIPINENVNNVKMLDRFSPKLLNESQNTEKETNETGAIDITPTEIKPSNNKNKKTNIPRSNNKKKPNSSRGKRPSKPSPSVDEDE